MSTDKGYIKLYRDVCSHWIWNDSDYLKAWIDILMMVNHEDKKILFDKKLITVKRGSRITSIRSLSARWGWSRGRVSRFLDMLERDKMIATKRDTKKTMINVVNYGFYQDDSKRKKPRSSPQTEPLTEPQTGPQTEHKQYTIEGIKKNEEENTPTAVFGDDDTDEAEGWGFE